jgi:hypothetical protein
MRLRNALRAEAGEDDCCCCCCLAGSGAVWGAFVVRCRYRLVSGLSLIASRLGSQVEDDAAEGRAWPLSTMVAVMAVMGERTKTGLPVLQERVLQQQQGDCKTWDASSLGVYAPASNRSFPSQCL